MSFERWGGSHWAATSFAVLFVAACLVIFAPANAHGQQDPPVQHVTLQLRWDNQAQFAGYYAAKWQGYYEDAGLDVDIRPGITPEGVILTATEEVASGRADYGVGAADILIARDRGAPLVVLATVFQRSAARFYAREGTGLRTPRDLMRLKVARKKNDLVDVELQAMLRRAGLDPDDVKSVPHQPGIDHLTSGAADVIPGYSISLPWDLKGQSVDYEVLNPVDFGVDFYGDSLFTTEELVTRDPEAAKRFTEASMRGWEYALEHPEEMAQRITNELPRSTTPSGDLLEMNRFQMKELAPLTGYPVVKVGSTNTSRWQAMNEALMASGVVSQPLEVGEFVSDPEALAEEQGRTLRRWLYGALGGVVLLGVVAAAWVTTLQSQVRRQTKELRAANSRLDQENEELVASQQANQELIGQVEESNVQLNRMMGEVVKTMGRVVEMRDPYTQGHELGVSKLARMIAVEMGLPESTVSEIELAAGVHDVGKLSVPVEILSRPGVVSSTERLMVEEHPRVGYDIVKQCTLPEAIALSVLQHHERMDGSGYPGGLKGDEISVAARVIGVADVVDAMACHRPYRPAVGLEAAMRELESRPDAYDPEVVAACLRLYQRGELDYYMETNVAPRGTERSG